MSKYLITTTEVYRVDTEGEVETLITEAKEEMEEFFLDCSRVY